MNGDGVELAHPCMLDEARALAELGMRVFPCAHVDTSGVCACIKGKLCDRPGKHPMVGDWPRNATCDPEQIAAWWKLRPHANIGIATGLGSGVAVLDVDGPEGRATLLALEQIHGPLPLTATASTAKGHHYYFVVAGPVKTSTGELGKGLDTRGDGGYVIAAPSLHASGVRYAWLPGRRLGGIELAVWPEWLNPPDRSLPATPSQREPTTGASIADRNRAYGEGALLAECATVRGTKQGARNDTFNRSAFKVAQLVAGGVVEHGVARDRLIEAARGCGLDDLEIRRTLRSAFDGASQSPRHLPDAVPTNGHAAPPTPTAAVVVPVPVPVPDAPPSLIQWVGVEKIFAELYPPRWVARGLHIGPGRPTLIAGYGASAKTLSAQAMALAKAAGRLIWNRFECEPGVVLHLDYEQGMYATAKRYQRLSIGHAITQAELGDRLRLAALPRLSLDDPKALDAMVAATRGVELVIIDALKGSTPTLDENDSSVRSVLDMLNRVSDETGAAFVMLHHAGKPKDSRHGDSDARTLARGSSAIFDASGCVLNFVAGVTGSDPKRVEQVKMPAEAEGAPIESFQIVIEDVAVDDRPTAGVRAVWSGAKPLDQTVRASAAYDRDSTRLLAAVSAYPGASSNAVVERSGIARQRALALLSVLIEEGKLTVLDGPNRSKRYQLTPSQSGSE